MIISEKKFAQAFTSFWKEHLPWFSNYYSTINALGKRFGRPIEIEEASDQVYINNIIATSHFENILKDPDCKIDKSFKDSIPIIDAFSKQKRMDYSLTDDYREIISKQAERLISKYNNMLVHNPSFPGYGVMGNCRGDLLCGTTLVEIKANRQGNRKPFKPEDFRQLLVYCALNYLADSKYVINKIELFNPRMGYVWQSDLEEFIYIVTDSTSSELFESIGDYLSELSDSIDLETDI